MTDIKVTTDGSVGAIIEGWVTKLNPAMAKEVLRLANIAGGYIADMAYAYLNKRGTGTLAKSFLPARFIDSSAGIAAGALSDLPYAGIQNDGGTITGKSGKLAVPLTPQAKKKWPRDWADKELVLIPFASGKAVLATKTAAGKIKAQYALVDSVNIKGTHYLDHAEAATAQTAEGESPTKLANDAFDAAGGD